MSIFPFLIICKIVQVLYAPGGAALYKEKLYQLLRACIIIVTVIIVYILLQHALPYIYPFLLAALLSVALNPAVTMLEKKVRLPRGLAAFFVIAAAFVIALGVLILLVSELIQGTLYLADRVPAYVQQLIHLFNRLMDEQLLPIYKKISALFHSLSPEQQAGIHNHMNQLINQWANKTAATLQNVLMQIPGTLAQLPGYAAIFLFIIMAAFFITSDWHRLTRTWEKLMPEKSREAIRTLHVHLKTAFCGFIKAQFLLITITALIIYTGLAVAGVNHALTIAMFAAALDILPVIGTGAMFIPWIAYAFLTGDHSMTSILAVLYAVVVIQRELLEPKLLSDQVGLSPLAALTALFAGFQLWGAGGLLAGPFIAITGKGFYQAGVFHWLGKFIKGH
ncbi:sporulation integral membrane protein YtvI [Lentibacillus lipolyticus]|nr:sporulation integral membrane protein YtvI [Lentibacillus lipolyticus]